MYTDNVVPMPTVRIPQFGLAMFLKMLLNNKLVNGTN